MAPAIRTQDLVVRFGGTAAVDGISIEVEAGSVVGILGPNGAGKTTFIRVLATQQAPTSGRAWVAGADVVTHPREVQRRIGVTGQYAALDDDLTPTENLELVAALAGLPRPAASTRIDDLRARLGLPDDRTRLGQLSGGNRRRVDLAAGLLARPAVVMLDEPTTGLDPGSRLQLWELVGDLRDEGVTVVLTTQYLEEADRLADRVVILDHGRIVTDGSPAEVKARVGGQVVRVTLGSDGDLARAEARLRHLGATPGVDPQARRLTVSAADPSAATTFVAALGELGVAIEQLEVTSASLDDAFLRMTAA